MYLSFTTADLLVIRQVDVAYYNSHRIAWIPSGVWWGDADILIISSYRYKTSVWLDELKLKILAYISTYTRMLKFFILD